MDEEQEAIAFVGETLSPFFLDESTALFEAFSKLDARQAAGEWPFAEEGAVYEALGKMTCGASDEQVWEYRRLFVGPAKKAAPPWGSVYTDRDKVIFGRSTLALRDWLRFHGVEYVHNDGMPEDHIGLQLACMAWLVRNKPALLNEYLSQHLLTWAPHFLKELSDVAQHRFYQGLAELTCVSLQGIADARDLRIVEPRFYR